MLKNINTGDHAAGIVEQGNDINPAFPTVPVRKLWAETAVPAPDLVDMRAFITPHVAVWSGFQFRLYLCHEPADHGLRYLSVGDGSIVGKLPEDGCGRHAWVAGFQITDLFLEIRMAKKINVKLILELRSAGWDGMQSPPAGTFQRTLSVLCSTSLT